MTRLGVREHDVIEVKNFKFPCNKFKLEALYSPNRSIINQTIFTDGIIQNVANFLCQVYSSKCNRYII